MAGSTEQDLLELEHKLLGVLTEVARLRIRTRDAEAPPPAAPELAPSLPADLVEVGVAAAIARRPCDTVRTWCRAMPIDQPGGFAIKLRGRWHVSRRLFLEYIRR